MLRRAFTLIELLVVIAIIAILAAILFPVFAQAKQSAKQAAAISSVKQGMTCLIMYASDYDDEQPPYLWYRRPDGVWLTWMEMVNPYMKNKDVYINPGASRTPKDFYSCSSTANPTLVSHYIIPMWINYNYWYWFNNVIMFAGYPRHPSTCTSISPWAACLSFTRAELPAETATLVPGFFISYKRPTGPEKDTQFGSACVTGVGPYVDKYQRSQDRKIQVFRDGGIYGMADGHAKWQASRQHNKDNSYKHNYSGADYPGSPYMKVLQ